MNTVPVFETSFKELIVGDVQTVLLDRSEKFEALLPREDYRVGESKTLSCSYCKVKFTNATEQREHYKLDWHRYNLKRNLSGKDAINEDEFNTKYGETPSKEQLINVATFLFKDDVSSISGSDTDSEKEDGVEEMALAQGKLFLKSGEGKVFSIYRCLIAEKKEEIAVDTLTEQLQRIHGETKWSVFMLGGGHFAGAVFDKGVPILHKTFHCYTVRAGQGGSQSSRDNKSATSNPRSAGASLRRYNEQAFGQHITDIVTKWREDIDGSSLIFCRAPGPYNKSILFGGKTPLLTKGDNRLRYIPFSTRRATFAEIKRVHAQLATVSVYDSIEAVLNKYSELKRTKVRNTSVNRAKSREPAERPLPDQLAESEGETSTESTEYTALETEINFNDSLQSFEETSPRDRKKHPQKKKKSKNQRRLEQEKARKDELADTIKSGDLNKLKNVFKTYEGEESAGSVNEILDEEGNSLLHLAAFHEKAELVQFLLDCDADVCAKNKKQQTAYTCTKSVEIREVFKAFAGLHPEKHNYNKAQIPVANTNLTPEELEKLAEKKKLQKKAKRDKEKEKRKAKEAERKEQDERDRFASLTDREKRALAAERRILSQSGAVIARCFLCGHDISGKVPFEYLGNRFCTIECLKAHRIKSQRLVS